MAYIRLRISNREFELEGSEEFITRMENKMTLFLEGATGRQSAKNYIQSPISEDLQTFSNSEGIAQAVVSDEYVRSFMEKYNSFNSNIAIKKSF